MLSRLHRLTKRKDFDVLFKRGKLVYGRQLQARVVKTVSEQPCRVAVIISAKTEKSAVRRNRAKRQVREIIRAVVTQLQPGHDIALTIKTSFLPLSFTDKRETVLQLLKKAGVVKGI